MWDVKHHVYVPIQTKETKPVIKILLNLDCYTILIIMAYKHGSVVVMLWLVLINSDFIAGCGLILVTFALIVVIVKTFLHYIW